MSSPSSQAVAVGCIAAVLVYVAARKLLSAEGRIRSLRLELLRLQTADIQTLRGASARKDWLAAHPAHEPWAQGLLATQQGNAVAALSRPANAEPLLLYNGAENGDIEAVKAGLASGYCPNCEAELHPKFGTSPLMEACFHGHDDIVQLLIEHNAQLNIKSGYGWTALHYAGQAKQVGAAALLVAAGADRTIRNNKGKTACERAVAQKKVMIAELLA